MCAFDIVAVGEAVVDFIARMEDRKLTLEGSAGGAPANVLVQARKLGRSVAFVGMIGQDILGRYLRHELEAFGVDTSCLLSTAAATTSADVIELDEYGDRSFEFLRAPGADTLLVYKDSLDILLENARIIHYGSISMSRNPMAQTQRQILKKYRGRVPLSCDVNLRELAWDSPVRMLEAAREVVAYADIVKMGKEELLMLTGEKILENAISVFFRENRCLIAAFTMGREGSLLCTRNSRVFCPPYAVHSRDTTGAGDSFFGAFLHGLLALPGGTLPSEEQLLEIGKFANAAGALSTTIRGTMLAMPSKVDIDAFMRETPLL